MGFYGNLRVESQRVSPSYSLRYLAGTDVSQGCVDSSQGPLLPFHKEGGMGDSTFVPSDPSSPVLGLITFASREGEDWDQGRPWRKQIPAGGLVWMELCPSGWEEEVPAWGAEQAELKSCSVAPASSSFGT